MINKRKPLVSVLCSSHNQATYLNECLDSLVNQTYQNIEIIIIDDASIDETWAMLQDRAAKDSRLVVKRNETRKRLAQNLNQAISLARGEYLARMDTDDVADLIRIEKQVAYLQAHEQTWMVGSFVQFIDQTGKELGMGTSPTDWEGLKKLVLKKNPLFHPTWMMRKALVEQTGGYNVFFQVSQDYEFIVKRIWKYRMDVISEPLVFYRRTRQQFRRNYYYRQIGFMLLAKVMGMYYKHTRR